MVVVVEDSTQIERNVVLVVVSWDTLNFNVPKILRTVKIGQIDIIGEEIVVVVKEIDIVRVSRQIEEDSPEIWLMRKLC